MLNATKNQDLQGKSHIDEWMDLLSEALMFQVLRANSRYGLVNIDKYRNKSSSCLIKAPLVSFPFPLDWKPAREVSPTDERPT